MRVVHCISAINVSLKVMLSLLQLTTEIVLYRASHVCTKMCIHSCYSWFRFSFLWSPYGIGQTIIFLPCGFFFLSSSFVFLAWSQRSEIGCLPYFHTWCGLSANLGCRSETCCTRLCENAGRKKSPFAHHRSTLSGYIFATKACIDNRIKLVKQQ